MANQEHVAILKQGADVWNKWREDNPEIIPDLTDADLIGVHLQGVNLSYAELMGANLSDADLSDADLSHTDLLGTIFLNARLHNSDLVFAFMSGTILRGAHLVHTNLASTRIIFADFREAHLSDVDLNFASLIATNFTGATLMNCNVFGVSVWEVRLEEATQYGLVITREGQPRITVDNLEVAQFLYLLLNNRSIRRVIDTITSKVVLIVGHFPGERKAIVDGLQHDLRTRHYSPVVFDVEELDNLDFRETLRTLANMARFVLVDLTDLDDVLDEIVKIVPHCRVPMQPLLFLDSHRHRYSQFLDLRHNHRWVLPLYCYQDSPSLLAAFQERIIEPVEEKSGELKGNVLQIFFYYAQEDVRIFDKLKKHLTPFERSGQIAMWDDQKLAPGEEKRKEIEKHLSSAHIVLLLVSPDFLASNECIAIQERAMERYESGDATVIPLILRPCGWQSTPLGKLQALPRDEKPLARRGLDNILFEVTDEIADVIKELL